MATGDVGGVDGLVAGLARSGVQLVRVPAGTYPVGLDAGADDLLALPPQWHFGPEPRATPSRRVTLADYWIAAEPLRLSHLRALAEHDSFARACQAIDADAVARAESRIATSDTVEVEPTYGELQYAFAADEPRPGPSVIARQIETDPVLELTAAVAEQVAEALGGRLPAWHEWEVAVRGPRGLRYPWGDELDLAALSLERQDYSVEDSGTMGYYSYDQEISLVHSFGPYADSQSPFGLRGLARAGREWNACVDGEPTAEAAHILRSLADLGAMARMIPGIRPNTYGSGGWHHRKHQAFSGPVAAAWAVADEVFELGALRLVIAGGGAPG